MFFNNEGVSLLTLVLKGGWIMLPIFLLSFIAIYIICHKLIDFAYTTKYSEQWFKNLKNSLLEGDSHKAVELCDQRKKTLISRIIKKVLFKMSIDKNIREIDGMIESIGKNEIYILEEKVSSLGVIAGAAPMFGFLGTVTGLIQSFIKIANSKSQINPSVISGGIYEAMITTAAGLAVGIIAYLGYNYLVIKINKITNNLEYRLSDISDAIKICYQKMK